MRIGFPARHARRLAAAALVTAVFTAPAFAAAITLIPSKDNTLYEATTGNLSNGAGDFLFTGRTSSGGAFRIRRALLAFDLATAIPSDAVVTRVELSLFVSNFAPAASAVNVNLFRLTADWGESSSRAVSPEGAGGAAQAGDATWLHRFSPGMTWTTPGGDFLPQSSAATTVNAENRSFVWSDPGLVNDVQAWLLNPTTNFGWIIRGNEVATGTAIRFNSRTNPIAAQRPQLTVEYVPEPGAFTLVLAGLFVFRRRFL